MVYYITFALVFGPILAILLFIARIARRGWEIEAEMHDRAYEKQRQERQRRKAEFQH